MSLLTKLAESLKGSEEQKKLTLAELKKLGYELTGRKISVGSKRFNTAVFTVNEVRDEDLHTKKIPFSYLYSEKAKTGVILPECYSVYVILA